jgi:glycosyltransferase involved in cell wall biosynthesis
LRDLGKLRIAQVSPLYESVPPKLYGGTERVVAYLTDELVRQGHKVTLFASGDSITTAELVPCCGEALRLSGGKEPFAPHFVQLEQVLRRASDFDIIHFHTDFLHYPVSRRASYAHITTLHGRLDLPELAPLYREFHEMPLVSISEAQRAPLPWANWQTTVHHGLPLDLLSLGEGKGSYLAFLGRISPEKRCDRAIAIAKRFGMPLKIAAKVDKADAEYYESAIRPLLNHPLVEFIGEIGDHQKSDFLGNAYALLFPIDWPEPFGMVMIESMACGTPVIAFPGGSVREVVDDGITGAVVTSIDEAVKTLAERVPAMSRLGVRAHFEQRFSAERMASDYVSVYGRMISRKHRVRVAAEPVAQALPGLAA